MNKETVIHRLPKRLAMLKPSGIRRARRPMRIHTKHLCPNILHEPPPINPSFGGKQNVALLRPVSSGIVNVLVPTESPRDGRYLRFEKIATSQPSDNEIWESCAFRDSDVSAWSEARTVCERVQAIAIVRLIGAADAVAGLYISFTGVVGSVDLDELWHEIGFADQHQMVEGDEAEQRGEYVEAHCGYVAFGQRYTRKLAPMGRHSPSMCLGSQCGGKCLLGRDLEGKYQITISWFGVPEIARRRDCRSLHAYPRIFCL